jgi:hypothetical protein
LKSTQASYEQDQKDVEFSEAEILIQQLQRQIAQTSTRRDAKQPIDEFAIAVPERHYAAIGIPSQQSFQVQTIQPLSSSPHLIQELGWTKEQATAIRYRFAAFREDWEAPGMEIYDDL